MKLEDIGFYTLSNERVKQTSENSPIYRLEIIITDKCNFNCLYCRGIRKDCKGTKTLEEVKNIIDICSEKGLKNIRFSGGEPTLHPDLLEMVKYAKRKGCERIAISTNGYSDFKLYFDLACAGVNDFSISLDACCSEDAKKMCGGKDIFHKVIDNIKKLSSITYVTVGMVFTPDNMDTALDSVLFADSLGVSDIRVISSAQYNGVIKNITNIPENIRKKYPILNYRLNNFEKGLNVRGISEKDNHFCPLVIDDIAVAGNYHFPCIIYLREQGNPIGEINSNIREERLRWFLTHNVYEDEICKKNCLDVCLAYNNCHKKYNTKGEI